MLVYILKSVRTGRFYIGFTDDLKRRLEWHNAGITRSTKYGIPWKIVYTEKCNSKTEAIKREKQIKSYKGGNGFRKLIGGVA